MFEQCIRLLRIVSNYDNQAEPAGPWGLGSYRVSSMECTKQILLRKDSISAKAHLWWCFGFLNRLAARQHLMAAQTAWGYSVLACLFTAAFFSYSWPLFYWELTCALFFGIHCVCYIVQLVIFCYLNKTFYLWSQYIYIYIYIYIYNPKKTQHNTTHAPTP